MQRAEELGAQDAVMQNQARDRLINQHRGYVVNLVKRMMAQLRLPPELFDELLAAGYYGMVEAASRFFDDGGGNFTRYAFLRIRGAVIDAIRQHSQLCGRAYRFAQAMRAVQELREDAFHSAEEKPIRERRERLAHILDHGMCGALAFRMSLHDAEEEIATYAEPTQTPEGALERRDEWQRLRKYVDSLDTSERYVITEYYFKHRSFSDIARKRRGLSRSWVSRLHTRALKKLKERYVQAERPSAPKKSAPVHAQRRSRTRHRMLITTISAHELPRTDSP